MGKRTINSYAAFWPYYLAEHSARGCRVLHFIGTSLLVGVVLLAVVLRAPLLLLACPVIGYGFAWVGHFFVERNRPATFTYPLWSLVSDFRMWGCMLSGRLWSTVDDEIAALKARTPARP